MKSVISQDILSDVSRFMEENVSLRKEIDSLASELSNRYEELNLIYSIGNRLKVSDDLLSTARYVIKEASGILHGHTMVLSVPDKGIFEYVSGNAEYSTDRPLDIINEIRKECNSGKTHIVVNRCDEFRGNGFTRDNWFKFIATPVKLKDECRGVLIALSDPQEKDYTTCDLKLMTVLAGQLSIIITNNELYQNLKDFLLNFVKSMVSVIEAKDTYTRGHSERVNGISVMIARAMGLSQKDIENINWASILHDIGKIGVSESILTKPGRLTEEEYNIIKTHPMKGHEILKHIIQLKDALQGITYHQETYDGSGYPEGLKGKEIPLYARIIAVADTYDSITSSRAYRMRNTHVSALKEIERVSGSQLDPEIVEIFKKVCEDHPDFIRGDL